LQAKEHAAAEKQLAAQVATDPSAGSAIQLSAAPMLIVIKVKSQAKTSETRAHSPACAPFFAP